MVQKSISYRYVTLFLSNVLLELVTYLLVSKEMDTVIQVQILCEAVFRFALLP